MKEMMKVWSLLLSVQNFATYFTGRIAPDERVIFFPTQAYQRNATHWNIPIHGWIFQPKENDVKRFTFRSLLRRILRIPAQSSEDRILNHRLNAFVVDNERWKRPKITLAGKDYWTHHSQKNGHSLTHLTLSTKDLLDSYSSSSTSRCSTSTSLRSNDPMADATITTKATTLTSLPKFINYYAWSSDGTRQYNGIVHLIPPTGITILSDIDDTVKITNVVQKREMLRNTFIRPFVAVPGMAQVYEQWCGSTSSTDVPLQPHVHLHFLSASMYQLYEELEDFRQMNAFPPATYTLKTVRPKRAGQTIRILLENPMEFKRRSLQALLRTHPQRQFVLVGDTGEKDPQVYASIASEYPQQIMAIYLRSVAKSLEDDVPARVAQVMKVYDIPQHKWTVFQDASELLQVDLHNVWKEHLESLESIPTSRS